MAKTWKFIVSYSIGGGVGSGKWQNVFHINNDHLLTAPGMQTDVDALVSAIRPSLLSTVTIQQVTVKDPLQEGQGYDPAKVKSFGVGLNGTKLIGAAQADIKQITTFYRMSAASGRPGRLMLRMAVLDGEAYAGGDGSPSSAGAPSGAAELAAALNALIAGGTDLRKYGKRKSGEITDASVTAVSYGGVRHRTATRYKKRDPKKVPKTPQGLGDLVLRSVSPLYNSLSLAQQFEDATGLPAVATLQQAIGLLLPGLGSLKGAATALKALP
jgi:hypothetical protein